MHGAGGQLVDVSLVEPLARLVEQATLAYDQLGVVQARSGNRVDASAPRNAYRTCDDKWVAVSSAASSTAMAVYRAIERPDLAAIPEYVDPVPRQQRSEEIDRLVAEWVGRRTFDAVMKVFLAEGVAAAPVYDASQLLADEHFRAAAPSWQSTTRSSAGSPCSHRLRCSAKPPVLYSISGGNSAPTTTASTATCWVWTRLASPPCAPRARYDAAASTPFRVGNPCQQ